MSKADEKSLAELEALDVSVEGQEHAEGAVGLAAAPTFNPWQLLLELFRLAPEEVTRFLAWRSGPVGGIYMTPPAGNLNIGGTRAAASIALVKKG